MLFEKIHLEVGEDVLRVVRRHWFILAAELIGVIAMALLPFILLIALNTIPSEGSFLDFNLTENMALITYAISGWLTISIMMGYNLWTHYYLDLWIITDRRIIVVDQVTFFSRNVSSFRLERLQDIEFYINGIIPTFLNFGTIKMQTASAFESNFKTTGLPDPRGLQSLIQQAMDKRLAILHNNPAILE